MGMRGKITFIFKEKNFFFFAGNRRKIGGIRGWGGNRYKLWKNEKI
jgi:hypothetical protein